MGLRKMLFVGCGGSGLETIRLIRRGLVDALLGLGFSEEDFPAAWQFIGIDVPATETATNQAMLDTPGIHYAPLTKPGMMYRGEFGVDALLVAREATRRSKDFACWRPEPDDCMVDIAKGAGQVRGFGRAIAAYSLNDAFVSTRLDEAVREMRSTNGDAGLLPIERKLGLPPPNERDAAAFVVSSLGGGAGSGFFLDVLDALRFAGEGATLTWLQTPFAVLYDPTIFESEDGVEENGIRQNSLAAMSELQAAYLADRPEDWKLPVYFGRKSGSAGNRRGAEYSIIIGSTSLNEGFSVANRTQAYEVTASMLVSMTITPGSSESFFADVIGNVGRHGLQARARPIDGMDVSCPMLSAGFARVSTGRDRFARYASERMTTEIVARIANFGADANAAALVATGKSSVEAEVTRIVEGGIPGEGDLRTRFLWECGLDEAGEAHNQVIDRIVAGMGEFPKSARDRLKSVVREKVGSSVNWDGVYGAINGSGVVSVVGSVYQIPEAREVMAEGVKAWAAELQVTILDTVTSWVYLHGIHVTAKVVSDVTKMLIEAIPAELANEVESLRKSFVDANPLVALKSLLTTDGDKKYKPASDIWAKIDFHLDAFFDALQGREVRSEAGRLFTDLAVNVFRPLERSLLDAAGAIGRINREQLDELSGVVVARHLYPPKNEFSFTSVSDFPIEYRNYVTGPGVRDALLRAFCGKAGPDAEQPAPLLLQGVNHNSAWITKREWVPNYGGGMQSLDLAFDFTLDGIISRTRAWLRAPENAVSGFIGETIRHYVTDGTDVAKLERAQKFADLLAEAFRTAQPMVQVDQRYAEKTFGINRVMSWSFYGIPFSHKELGEAGTVIRKMLETHGVATPEQKFLGAGSSRREILVYGLLWPMPLSTLRSVSSQILDTYTRLPRTSFWKGVRCRPLGEAIPLDRDVKRQLVRGWITARLLDLATIDEATRTCRITDPRTGVALPLLSSVSGVSGEVEEWEYLAGAMEAALLADLFATMSEADGLAALTLLLSLGNSSGEASAQARYDRLHPALRDRPPPGLKNFAGASDVPGALGMVEEFFQNGESKIVASERWQRVPLHLQIASVIEEAAGEMRAACDETIAGPHAPG